ncbi:MAG: hypothetical protein R3C56_02870 [Pirellulaceae bacterium]
MITSDPDWNEFVKNVIDRMEVTSGGSGSSRNAHVLELSYKDPNADDAQKILLAIIGEYQKFVSSKFTDVNLHAAKLIKTAHSELESDIEELEDDYREFRLGSPLISSGSAGSDIHTARYEELAAEYSRLAIETAQARGRLDFS